MALLNASLSIGNGSSANVDSSSLVVYANLPKVAFAFSATVAAEKAAVILQYNPDPLDQSLLGWLDYRTTAIRLVRTTTGAQEAQTDGTFTTLVTGIFNTTAVSYMVEFTPFPARYRLRFSPQSASTNITVANLILTS